MTVQELIDQLRAADPDADVGFQVGTWEGPYSTESEVNVSAQGEVTILVKEISIP